MLGFLKKKKQTDAKSSEDGAATAPAKKKKGLKKWIFIMLILGGMGGGGYFAYVKFFATPPEGTRIYTSTPMAHVKLPQEMMAFSFEQFPDLYDALVIYNVQMNLIEAEIKRIDAVASKYPEQKKIADAQKKVWVKGKNTLLKAFTKLEKPVKEIYVLYQVNPAKGTEQIQARAPELANAAQAALKPAQELTERLKENASEPPQGVVDGTIYKIKKMFQ